MLGFGALNAQALNASGQQFYYELPAFDPFQLKFKTPLYETSIPDVYGGMPRANIHPGIEYFPTGWNGWKYWMVYTPYPDSNYIYENPCIVVSNNGVDWQAPDGLTNPVVTPSGVYYADVDLFYDRSSDKLCMAWKSQVPLTNNGDTYLITSSDGVNWSEKVSLLASPLLATVSLTYDANRSLYELIGLDFANGKADPDFYSVYTCSTVDGTYTYDRTLSLEVGAGEHYWNLYIKRLDDGSYVGMGQETTASLSGTGAVYWLKSSDGTNFTRQLFADSEMFYRCIFTLIPDANGDYRALMSGVDYFSDMRSAALSSTETVNLEGQYEFLDEGFDSGSVGHVGQELDLSFSTGFSVSASEAVTTATTALAVWDAKVPECSVKFNATYTENLSEIFAVGRFVDQNNYIRVGIRKDRPSPSYKSVDVWSGFYEEVVGGTVTVSDFLGGDLVLFNSGDEITVSFKNDFVSMRVKDSLSNVAAFANPTNNTHKESNKFGIAAFGTAGDVAFQNMTLSGDTQPPKVFGASTTTSGGEVLVATSATITTNIPSDIDLKWGETYQVAVTHDGGTTTFDGVLLEAQTGWEYVNFTNAPDEASTESFYEHIKTDATVGNYTMVAGDQLAWTTSTGLTLDGQTIPTVSPAATVTGSYKVWSEALGSWSATSSYTITDLGVPDLGGGGDTTAPTLSAPTAQAVSFISGSGSVSTNEANGTLYAYVSTNASETASTVKTGLSQTVAATGSQAVTLFGLSPETTYYAHYLHRDAAGNDSAVSSSGSFTTPAIPAPSAGSANDRLYVKKNVKRKAKYEVKQSIIKRVH